MLKLYRENSTTELSGTERASLFQNGNIHKNLVISFPNGDGPDGIENFDNEHIVKESLRFTESICSEDYLKFGLAEKSVLEFKMQGIGNIKGKTITAKLVIDGGPIIGKVDVPLGRFHVDSCKSDQSIAKINTVTAYGVAFSKGMEDADEDADYEPGSKDVNVPSNGVLELSPIEQAKRASYWKQNVKYSFKPYEYTASAITGFEYRNGDSIPDANKPKYTEVSLASADISTDGMSVSFDMFSGYSSPSTNTTIGAYYCPTLGSTIHYHADLCTVDVDISKAAVSPFGDANIVDLIHSINYKSYFRLIPKAEHEKLYYYPGQMIVTYQIFSSIMREKLITAFSGKTEYSLDESKIEDYLKYVWKKFAESGVIKQGYLGAIYSYGSYASSASTSKYYEDKHMIGFGAHRYVYPRLSVKTGSSSDWSRISAWSKSNNKYGALPALYLPKTVEFTYASHKSNPWTNYERVSVIFDIEEYISQHPPEWLSNVVDVSGNPLSVNKLYSVTVPDSVNAANGDVSVNRVEGKSPIYSKTAYYVATKSVNTDKSVVVDVDGTITIGPSTGSGGSSASGNDIDITSGTAELQGEFLMGSRDGDSFSNIPILNDTQTALKDPVDTITKQEYSELEYETAGVAPYRKIVGEYTKTVRGSASDGSEDQTSTRNYTLKLNYEGSIENTQIYDIRDNGVLKNQTYYGTDDKNDTSDVAAVSASIKNLINTLNMLNASPYTAAELTMIGRPDIETGDFLNVQIGDNQYIRLLVTRRTLTGIQVMKDRIESVGTDDSVAGAGSILDAATSGANNDSISIDYITPEEVTNDICVWTTDDAPEEGDGT